MVALHHLGFLKVKYFWTAGKLWRTNMCDGTKFQQNRPDGLGLLQFFDFQDGRHPPSWILKFLVNCQIGGLMCIVIPYVTKNRSSGCWYIAFNNFQNGGRPTSWIFKSWFFWSAGKLWRTNMCHHAKFRRNRPNGFWYIAIFNARRYGKRGICCRRVSVCLSHSGIVSKRLNVGSRK